MNSSSPFISVVIPVYNAEAYLRGCLDSVVRQRNVDFEVVLVNDGSTDGSLRVCEEYAAKYDSVRLFSQENGGVSKARNKGIVEARGEWLFFCDSDDEMSDSSLDILSRGVSQNAEFVMGGYTVVGDGSEKYCSSYGKSGAISVEQSLDCMFYGVYQGYLFTKLFKKSVIDENKILFDEAIKFNEDRLFTVSYLACVEGGCYYADQSVYRYFLRPSSAMASLKKGFNRNFITDFYAFEKMVAVLGAKGYRNLFRVKCLTYISYKTICGMARGEVDCASISGDLCGRVKRMLSFRELSLVRVFYLYERIRGLKGKFANKVKSLL